MTVFDIEVDGHFMYDGRIYKLIAADDGTGKSIVVLCHSLQTVCSKLKENFNSYAEVESVTIPTPFDAMCRTTLA